MKLPEMITTNWATPIWFFVLLARLTQIFQKSITKKLHVNTFLGADLEL